MTLRQLPSVDALVTTFDGEPLPRALIVETARYALDAARSLMRRGEEADPEQLARREFDELKTLRPRRVINATGVLLHTNLGRAVLAPVAAEAAMVPATEYTPLELDLTRQCRGGRGAYATRLLTTLTGAEAAVVVNNNAAALFLALAALAKGGTVLVSRGELIEIGGSFRLPDIMAASGAHLLEVGTTNRTRLADYEAVVESAVLILKVHPSNYRVEGFAESVGYEDLAGLANDVGIPLVADVGSGLLDSAVPWLSGPAPQWVGDEPGVKQTLAAGAGVVLFSGDKMLGGPQAGVAVGRADLIAAMAEHPVARAVRCDGSTLSALAATLELYADGRADSIPFWAAAAADYQVLEARAESVLAESGIEGEVRPGHSLPGAGSVPGTTLPSPVIRTPGDPDGKWRRLLEAETPVVGRREEGSLLIDLRAVSPDDDHLVAEALRAACR